VAGVQEKPILLVDVDGVISLWGFPADARPDGAFAAIDGMPHFLSTEAGRHLRALSETFDLVWCTGWEEKANEYLPSLLGLPGPLPHLSFDRHVPTGTTMPGHWKLGAIDAYVDGRAVAWVDDAFNDACHKWARERAHPTLLVETEPATGLRAAHAERLVAWARQTQASRT
jgi:HAD domain in Swiss Army Knife RNA repair proteins